MADRPSTGDRVPGAYEPLYRAGEPADSTDPGWGRHSAPDRESPVEDQYGWLYRNEEPAPAHSEPVPVEQDDTSPRMPVVPPPPVNVPVEPLDEPPDERRRGGVLIVVVGLLVAILVVAGVLIARWWTAPRTGADPPASSAGPSAGRSASTAPTTSATGSYQGGVAAVSPDAVTAGCTAADAKDDAGATVSYAASNVSDGNTATAWRCDGSADGEQLVITLPAGTSVAELGLINGYAKVDPKSGKDRYAEYRRITEVTWTVGDQEVKQELSGGEEGLQTVRIPPTTTDQVTLTIDRSSAPGSSAKTRDAVLISELRIGAPA